MIYFTSDTHFNHNKPFLYEPRGFTNIYDHDNQIIKNWNNIVSNDDDIYLLGDVMLGDNNYGISCLKQLKGKIHIIPGNHCTDSRIELYHQCFNVVEVLYATRLKYNGYHFFLTHFPCVTSNLEKEHLKQCTINLYGHTHQKHNFYEDMPFMYHVGCDSHNCTPVLIDDIIEECKAKVVECKEKF